MDIEHTPDSEHADELLNDSISPPADDAAKRHAGFKAQLTDYEYAAEANPNPLGRALAYVTADVLNFTVLLAEAIKHGLPEGPVTLADLEQVKGPLNEYFKAARQVDRYANLELRACFEIA